MSHASSLAALRFYRTAPYACSYLPEKTARSQVAAPAYRIDQEAYGSLLRLGFRRSGLFVYRPRCDDCRACVPVRLPVERLTWTRGQRRAWRRHASLEARVRPLDYDEAHYRLYVRYQTRRHPDGSMAEDSGAQYSQFLLASPLETQLLEFVEDGALRMVSVIDVLEDGLSAVYTFFDPDIPGASFGVYNILWQARLCQSLNLPYLYLGYWIRDTHKMAYKANFRPLEGYLDGIWRELHSQDTKDS
jgi:arginine-tRNA-protein transferase